MNAEQTRIDREVAKSRESLAKELRINREVIDMQEFFKTLTHEQLVNVATELYRDATGNRHKLDDLQGIVR